MSLVVGCSYSIGARPLVMHETVVVLARPGVTEERATQNRGVRSHEWVKQGEKG